MTATQAARSFASILDAVEHGETVIITRDGCRSAGATGFTEELGAEAGGSQKKILLAPLEMLYGQLS